LRDAKMRESNLDSHDYPTAQLSVTKISGLPAQVVDGTTYKVTLSGQMTVHDRPAPVTWTGTASVNKGKLYANATSNVKLSRGAMGPISLAGLVTPSDNATLSINLVALDPSKYSIPTSIAAPKSAPRATTNVSFARDIMPILQANCASCHN